MKIDRHHWRNPIAGVKLRRVGQSTAWAAAFSVAIWALPPSSADDAAMAVSQLGKAATESASQTQSQTEAVESPVEAAQSPVEAAQSQVEAVQLLDQVLLGIVHGPAFDAKVRETVWTAGREVIGVGTYEQAGQGTGRFHLQITMHDGDGKHRLQQISDGRLAWTRTEIAGRVQLRRVDVGRLDEWVQAVRQPRAVSPRLLVGAWSEMLSTFSRDYVLRLDPAHLKGEPVWVISGNLRDDVRSRVLEETGRSELAELHPTRIRLAVRAKPQPETGFGQWIPVRIEFWSDPLVSSSANTGADEGAKTPASRKGRLVTLIELYSIRPIAPPPVERFRFENQDAEVNFVNETDRYIEQYGVRLTERQRRQLQR